MDLISLSLLVLGGTVVYKVITQVRNPNTVLPKQNEWGDDKLTYQKGQHLSDRNGAIELEKVGENLAIATIKGRKYFVNPQTLDNEPLITPPHRYV